MVHVRPGMGTDCGLTMWRSLGDVAKGRFTGAVGRQALLVSIFKRRGEERNEDSKL